MTTLPSDFEIHLPDAGCGSQDEEWCELRVNGDVRRIRFHDYHEIYAIPGLYEQLFYDLLECDSPRTVCDLLGRHLDARGRSAADLRVLDVGAGNGMVGEQLAAMGAATIVGVDIIPEAAEAARRDRPGTYDDYHVVDLTDIPPDVHAELRGHRFNCLATVAALGFGDIPPEAFAAAFDLVEVGGLVAFNIKDEFLGDGDGSGFSRLIDRAVEDGTLELCAERHYRHRLSVAGEPLHYVALVGEKRGELGPALR